MSTLRSRFSGRIDSDDHRACATSAQHDVYNVIFGPSPIIEARWTRMRGW